MGANLSEGGEPGHVYAFGVVGLDAVKVELVGSDGKRIEATLGGAGHRPAVRCWIVDAAGTLVEQVVATDSGGRTWAAENLVGIVGQAGCYRFAGVQRACNGDWDARGTNFQEAVCPA